MRRKMIAGNWKMNLTVSEAEEHIKNLLSYIKDPKCDVIICVPSVYLIMAANLVKGSKIKVGAQNMYCKDRGAYTGEIAPEMLTSAGTEYVIIGHSERRDYFKEDDDLINKKVRKALEYGIKPILCCGESESVRAEGKTLAYIKNQLELDLDGVEVSQLKNLIIAYEPIWAIGTGKVASAFQAEEVCAFIRDYIAKTYGDEVAQRMIILYGGSMKADNARELLAEPNIDGGLIGGASLRKEFVDIINMTR